MPRQSGRVVCGLVSLVTLAGGARGQSGPMTWNSLGLRGQVRPLVEQDLADNLATPKEIGVVFATRTTTFSSDGRALSFDACVGSDCKRTRFTWEGPYLLEERHEFSNGFPEETVRYVRDSEGRIIEEITSEGSELYKRLEISGARPREERATYYGDALTELTVSVRSEDMEKSKVATHFLGEDGTLRPYSEYRESETRLADGAVRRERRFSDGTQPVTRDADGRLLEKVQDSEESYQRETHQYDAFGREIEKAEWDRDGSNINCRKDVYVDVWLRR